MINNDYNTASSLTEKEDCNISKKDMMYNRKLLNDCKFIAGVGIGDTTFPKQKLPEVAFVGKSNVGKSSLINAITNNKKLARVSKNPGCTRQINFFSIGGRLLLTDLPGYGFARVSKKEQHEWSKLMSKYLRCRCEDISMAFILIDFMIGPKENDFLAINLFNEYHINTQIVFTKYDKEKHSEQLQKQLLVEKTYNEYLSKNMLFTSIKSNYGLEVLKNEVRGFAKE